MGDKKLKRSAMGTEPPEVQPDEGDRETNPARLALQGRAFDFWNERDEDIYSFQDGEAAQQN